MEPPRSLVSQKTSESDLHIQLHPLVLLTISDHISRHAARQQQGRVLGALLGQQNGREITMEHAFECPTTQGPNGEDLIPGEWFEQRVRQFKDVHKNPPLDIVGWWSTSPVSGPDASHLPIHRQLLQDYNESALFLAFHPSQLQASESHHAKLPLTIYESVLEGENTDGSKDMQIDGEESSVSIRFRELRYSVETEETEMIGVNTIVQGSGTAAIEKNTGGAGPSQGTQGSSKPQKDSKPDQVKLKQDQEDFIANLNTRLNAVRTLESRINLIKSYLSTVSLDTNNEATSTLSYPILREINSLLSHLALLSNSTDDKSFVEDIAAQKNDVMIASMLGKMGDTVKLMREYGRRSAMIQSQLKAAGGPRNKANAMASRFKDELYHGSSFDGSSNDFYS